MVKVGQSRSCTLFFFFHHDKPLTTLILNVLDKALNILFSFQTESISCWNSAQVVWYVKGGTAHNMVAPSGWESPPTPAEKLAWCKVSMVQSGRKQCSSCVTCHWQKEHHSPSEHPGTQQIWKKRWQEPGMTTDHGTTDCSCWRWKSSFD